MSDDAPDAPDASLTALLETLAREDYWVSNVYQTWGGAGNPFGEMPGWKAHLRNRSTTQVGSGEGATLYTALAAAYAVAAASPAWRSGYREEPPGALRATIRAVRPPPPPPIHATIMLAIPTEEDLF